jgi:pre-mRNA-splicing factor 38B
MPGAGPVRLNEANAVHLQETARAVAAQTAQSNKLKKAQLEKEQAEKKAEADKKKCHLHGSKKNKKCKFCQRYEDFVKGQEQAASGVDPITGARKGGGVDDDISERRGPLELVNSKTFGFSPLLQTHIVESAHLKALISLETFDELINEMYQFADNIEPYMTNSSTTPSALFCCIYRLFTMAIDSRQLKRLIDNTDNPYVRCSGFLFIRFGLPSEQLFPWLGEYLLDDEELRPAKDSEWFTTVGEFVEGLLSQDKYYSTVLPRLPMSTKRQLEAKLAPLIQYRKRTKANLELLDVYRLENVKVEANVNGDWLSGITLELIDDAPSRLKVRVRLEDSSEETVHLGKVILADRRYAGYQGQPVNKRDRSRSRDRTDWARDKGRPDKTLVDELRTKDREKAVCSSGKEYARKPLGYKASCALPREQGTASTRLMEEETFVPMKSMRRRSPSPATKEQEFRKAPSQEHQQRMQQLFEKYGMSKSQESASSNRDVEGPDMMRLG